MRSPKFKITWIKDEYVQHLRKTAVFLLIFTVIFLLIYKTLSYTFPFLIAFLIAWLLQPGIKLLVSKLKFRPTLAALLMTVLFFTAIFGLLTWLIIGLVQEAALLIQRIDPEQFEFITAPMHQLFQTVSEFFQQFDLEWLQQYEAQIFSLAQSGLLIIDRLVRVAVIAIAALPVWLMMFFVIIFSTFFLSRDLNKMNRKIKRAFSDQFVAQFQNVWSVGIRMIGRYIRSYMIVYTITFILTLIFFSIIQVNYALLLSLTAGIADVLPIFGIGFVYWPLAAYLLINGETALGIAVIIGYLVVTAIRQFIEPKLVADSIEIHPVMVLAILFFGLRAQSLMLIVYLIVLLMMYQMVKKAGLFNIKIRSESHSDADHQPARPDEPVVIDHENHKPAPPRTETDVKDQTISDRSSDNPEEGQN